MDADLAEAVEATIARLAALQDAEDQLTRRKRAIHRLRDKGTPGAEIVRQLQNALHDRGLTVEQLRRAGVSHASIMNVLREPVS
jgi:DNA polymerase III delta subunit